MPPEAFDDLQLVTLRLLPGSCLSTPTRPPQGQLDLSGCKGLAWLVMRVEVRQVPLRLARPPRSSAEPAARARWPFRMAVCLASAPSSRTRLQGTCPLPCSFCSASPAGAMHAPGDPGADRRRAAGERSNGFTACGNLEGFAGNRVDGQGCGAREHRWKWSGSRRRALGCCGGRDADVGLRPGGVQHLSPPGKRPPRARASPFEAQSRGLHPRCACRVHVYRVLLAAISQPWALMQLLPSSEYDLQRHDAALHLRYRRTTMRPGDDPDDHVLIGAPASIPSLPQRPKRPAPLATPRSRRPQLGPTHT